MNGALADFTRATELAPALARAYVNRGSVLVAMGQLNKALIDYDLAIELDPIMADVYQNRGMVYLLLGREEDANRDFARCLELDSSLKFSLEAAIKTAKQRMIKRKS